MNPATIWLGVTKYAAPLGVGLLLTLASGLYVRGNLIEADRDRALTELSTVKTELSAERVAVKLAVADLAAARQSLAVLEALEGVQASQAETLARRALARTNDIERKVDALPTSREPVLSGGNSVFGLVRDGRRAAFADAGLAQRSGSSEAPTVPPVAGPAVADQRPTDPDRADSAGPAPQRIIPERLDRPGPVVDEREPSGRELGRGASGAGDELAGGVANPARLSQPCTARDSFGISACLDTLFVWVIESHISSDDGTVWRVGENAVTEIHPLAAFAGQADCQKRGVEMATGITRQARRDGLRDEVLTRHTTLCGPVWTEYATGGESPFKDQWPDISKGFMPRERGEI